MYTMSVIHVGHIKNDVVTRFGDIVDLSDAVTVTGEHLEKLRLTRSLAAFSIAELADVDDQTAIKCVTDGSGDNGIDAVYYDPAERNCFLVQSKWIANGNGSVEVGDIQKFIQGIRDILEAKFERFNDKMQHHTEKVFTALRDANSRFTIVLAYSGEQPLSKEARAPLEDLLAEMNSPSEVMTLRILNQGELHSIVASGAAGEAVDLEVMLQQWGMLQNPYLAYYGQAAVTDIASWAQFGNHLTAKNLRQFKGLTEVNDSIAKTLSSNAEHFWYFNNGITILCESLGKKPLGGPSNETGTFECRGASVVNGAQTLGTIVDLAKTNSAALSGGRILVRLVSLENCPPGFGDELTRATNTQNRIEKRDFAALDPNQKRLRTELILEHQKEYAYQTGEQTPPGDAGCTLDEAAVALACSMPEVSLSVLAKREVGMLYEDITKPPYTTIFNASTTAAGLWRAVTILRLSEAQLKLEQQEKSGKEQLIAIHGNRFVLHIVFNRLTAEEQTLSEDAQKAALISKLVTESLAATISHVLQQFPGAYPANLFKNAAKCRDLKKLVIESA
ncbi:MAG: AIPR family protein [Acidobacteriaceae bacterium]